MIPLRNIQAETIIERLFDHFILLFGASKHIFTDIGSNCICKLVQNFENLFRMKHIKTTVYHPQSNASVERAHSTLKNLIKTSLADNGTDWDQNLKIISMAYNTTINLEYQLINALNVGKSQPLSGCNISDISN